MRIITTILLFSCLGLWPLFSQIPCNGDFINSGTAVDQGNCIQLTASTPNQQGCTWLNTPVDFSQPFTHVMTVNFGNLDANGADGICLVYQPNGPTCGGTGQGIGAAGIPNSFIVEFDTWDNGAALGDIPPDHCAVNLNGNMGNPVNGPVSLGNIEDGANHNISFSWDPAGNNYTIQFDGLTILSGSYDIVNLIFGGNNFAFWGYTSSTGAAFNTQTACPVLPPPITVEAGAAATVPCFGAQITLDGTASDTGPDFLYEWTTVDGNIVSGAFGLTPTVDAPGTYVLTLTNTNGGCVESDEVTISLEPLQVAIADPPFFPCDGSAIILNGSASSSGPAISYQWSTLDGQMIDGINTPFLEIGLPGTYTLTVIYDDGQSFCTEEISTEVLFDPNQPLANASVMAMVTCNMPTIQLSGLGSSSGSGFSYQWVTDDGLIVAGANTLFPSVADAGTYTLVVTNNDNGCISVASVEVEAGLEAPFATAAATGVLDCQLTEILLDGSGSSQGAGITYQWTTGDGNITGSPNSLVTTVDAAGTYTLTVLNEINGCSASVEAEAVSSNTPPTILIEPAGTLTCATLQTLLDASNSGPGLPVEFQWSTADGNILSGAGSSQAMAGAPGTYYLQATNTENGCTALDSVIVAENTTPPLADAGSTQSLSCDAPSLSLDGSASSQGMNFVYQWATTDGRILSGADGLMPAVDEAGTYLLEVTNTENGCTAYDSTGVSSDINAPIIALVLMDTLDCSTLEVLIDGSGSSQGDGLDYAWSTTDGSFIYGQDSTQILASQPGQYTLAITDLSNECYEEATVTVSQDIDIPVPSVAIADTLDCRTPTALLDGAASTQGSEIAYRWSTSNGQIVSGADSLQAVAGAAGIYQLLISNLRNGCIDSTSVQVFQDSVYPQVQLALPGMLTCDTLLTLLEAAAPGQPGPFSYLWETPDGNIASISSDSLSAQVDEPGTYRLSITNRRNGCEESDAVTVEQDTLHPLAEAGAPRILDCYEPVQQLDGSLSSSEPAITYQWLPITGSIQDGANSTSPTIGEEGTYQLLVSNTQNGCMSIDSTTVSTNLEPPIVGIAPPPIFTCQDSILLLDGSASGTGQGLEYLWETADGAIVSGSTSLSVLIAEAGQYTLQVTDTGNGCTAVDSTTVARDEDFPIAEILHPLPLTCNQPEAVLDASASSQGAAYSFQWSTDEGNFLAGQQGLLPMVNAAGNYTLQVTNLANNCRSEASVQVVIDTLAPVAVAGAPATLSCREPQLQLDGSNSSQGPSFTYQWSTTGGNIVSGADSLDPWIDGAGLYTLMVANTENGCSGEGQVWIDEDFEQPYVEIVSPEVLTCSRNTLQLDATPSDDGPSFSYSWTAGGGQILSGANTATPLIDSPGLYFLSILNEDNGCSGSAQVLAVQDTVKPTLAITPPDTLTCDRTSIALDASGSSSGPAFVFQWQTADGNIISGANSPNPTVDVPADYQLMITHLTNGCADSLRISVAQDTVKPTLSIAPPDTLTCARTSITLDASASSTGPEFAFLWQTAAGNIVNGADSPNPTVDTPEEYQLILHDLTNGCADSLRVSVAQDTLRPMLDITSPDTLTCARTSITLDASASSTGPEFAFLWQTNGGNIVSGANSPNPTVDAPADYRLMITSLANGCADSLRISVAQDTLKPTLVIVAPDTLTCARTNITLDASASSTGPEFAFLWQTNGGNIISGADSPNAIVDEAGMYLLLIQNNQNGCSRSLAASVVEDVEQPVIYITQPPILTCAVREAMLDAGNSSMGGSFVYQWSSGNGSIIDGASTPFPTVNAPGTYLLRLQNTVNGCERTAEVVVSQNIQAPVAAAGSDIILPCFEDFGVLDGNASSTGPAIIYQWSTSNGNIRSGSSSLVPLIDAPGLYTLEVIDTGNGCRSTDTAEVIADVPTAQVAASQPLCFGDTGAIYITQTDGGSPPYLFSINGGAFFQSSPNFIEAVPGNYTVVVQDANGCEYREAQSIEHPDSVIVIALEPVVSGRLGDSVQINVATNILLSEISTISWSNSPGLSCYDCLAPKAAPAQSTDYWVRVRSLNGCEDQAQVRVYVEKGDDVYIPNAFSPNGDGANDRFLAYARNGRVQEVRLLRVFNRWGEIVFEGKNFPPNDPKYGWDGRFRGEQMNPAVFGYFAEIIFADGSTGLFKGDVHLIR